MAMKRQPTKSSEIDNVREVVEEQAIPPDILLKLLMIEKRDNIIQALEYYFRMRDRDIEIEYNLAEVQSRVIALFFDIKSSLKLSMRKDQVIPFGDLDKLEARLLDTSDIKDLIKIFDFLSEFLYTKGVLKFATTLKYNKHNIELANKIQGFG